MENKIISQSFANQGLPDSQTEIKGEIHRGFTTRTTEITPKRQIDESKDSIKKRKIKAGKPSIQHIETSTILAQAAVQAMKTSSSTFVFDTQLDQNHRKSQNHEW